MHELQDLADILQIFLQLKPSFAAFWLGVPTMSQLFLSNLTLADFDGKFQLYLSDRALRFSDSGEQNMMIIPRNSVAAVKVRTPCRCLRRSDCFYVDCFCWNGVA